MPYAILIKIPETEIEFEYITDIDTREQAEEMARKAKSEIKMTVVKE